MYRKKNKGKTGFPCGPCKREGKIGLVLYCSECSQVVEACCPVTCGAHKGWGKTTGNGKAVTCRCGFRNHTDPNGNKIHVQHGVCPICQVITLRDCYYDEEKEFKRKARMLQHNENCSRVPVIAGINHYGNPCEPWLGKLEHCHFRLTDEQKKEVFPSGTNQGELCICGFSAGVVHCLECKAFYDESMESKENCDCNSWDCAKCSENPLNNDFVENPLVNDFVENPLVNDFVENPPVKDLPDKNGFGWFKEEAQRLLPHPQSLALFIQNALNGTYGNIPELYPSDKQKRKMLAHMLKQTETFMTNRDGGECVEYYFVGDALKHFIYILEH